MMFDTGKEWSWGALREEAVRVLSGAAVPEARRAAEWLLQEVLGCDRARLLAYPERRATLAQLEVLEGMLRRRLAREPLQYILGYAEFFGLRLALTRDVLIPRPETETVVEAALDLLRDRASPRVLDVGTGSGCIALALKHTRPDAEVWACDVSEAALAVAASNAAANGLAVRFLQADVLTPAVAAVLPEGLDLIVSNPPYIPDAEAETLLPEVRDYEPPGALFSGSDPLRFYRVISAHARNRLAPGGALVFETHADYADAVLSLLRRQGFAGASLRHDLSGKPRIVFGLRP